MSSTSRVRMELPLAMFRITCIAAVFMSGFAVHAQRVWPYALVEAGFGAFKDIITNAHGYLGLEPTSQIFPAPNENDGVARYNEAKTAGGMNFVTGFFDKKS